MDLGTEGLLAGASGGPDRNPPMQRPSGLEQVHVRALYKELLSMLKSPHPDAGRTGQ